MSETPSLIRQKRNKHNKDQSAKLFFHSKGECSFSEFHTGH